MGEARLRVTVAYSPEPRHVEETTLTLPAGSTVADALAAVGGIESALATGIWGRPCARDQVLCDGDRVEAYRPLQVDPKVARRERFRRQGSRAAGLFARKP